LNDKVARANSRIADAETAIGRFDDALHAAEADSERAAEHAFQADATREEASSEREKIQEKLDETLVKRHDLQVSMLPLFAFINNSQELTHVRYNYRPNKDRSGSISTLRRLESRILNRKWITKTDDLRR
jgi:hypothetical protein